MSSVPHDQDPPSASSVRKHMFDSGCDFRSDRTITGILHLHRNCHDVSSVPQRESGRMTAMTATNRGKGRAEFEGLLHQFVERKIELRAYELYEERGRSDGHALDDWVKAELEILRGSILSPLLRKS